MCCSGNYSYGKMVMIAGDFPQGKQRDQMVLGMFKKYAGIAYGCVWWGCAGSDPEDPLKNVFIGFLRPVGRCCIEKIIQAT